MRVLFQRKDRRLLSRAGLTIGAGHGTARAMDGAPHLVARAPDAASRTRVRGLRGRRPVRFGERDGRGVTWTPPIPT